MNTTTIHDDNNDPALDRVHGTRSQSRPCPALARDLRELLVGAGFETPDVSSPGYIDSGNGGFYLCVTAQGVLLGWRPGPDLLGILLSARRLHADENRRSTDRQALLTGIRVGLTQAISSLLAQSGYVYEPCDGDLLVTSGPGASQGWTAPAPTPTPSQPQP